MRLAEHKDYTGGNKAFFLLKFSNKIEHINSLRSGKLHMNNFDYFVKREETDEKKGLEINTRVLMY